jgi:hypothetical protein
MDIDYRYISRNVDPYTKHLSVDVTEKDHADDLGVDARIILKWNLVSGSDVSFVDATMNLRVP